jgi:hypothetical protein
MTAPITIPIPIPITMPKIMAAFLLVCSELLQSLVYRQQQLLKIVRVY